MTDIPGTLTFDYAFDRTALFYGRMVFTVEASTDGGSTWTSLWNGAEDLADAGSGSFQSGTCSLEIPEQFRTSGVQLAFHYSKKLGAYAGTVAVDNVKLTAPGGGTEPLHTLRAVATEGGVITPRRRHPGPHWRQPDLCPHAQ